MHVCKTVVLVLLWSGTGKHLEHTKESRNWCPNAGIDLTTETSPAASYPARSVRIIDCTKNAIRQRPMGEFLAFWLCTENNICKYCVVFMRKWKPPVLIDINLTLGSIHTYAKSWDMSWSAGGWLWKWGFLIFVSGQQRTSTEEKVIVAFLIIWLTVKSLYYIQENTTTTPEGNSQRTVTLNRMFPHSTRSHLHIQFWIKYVCSKCYLCHKKRVLRNVIKYWRRKCTESEKYFGNTFITHVWRRRNLDLRDMGIVSIDYSKAFDSLCHALLLAEGIDSIHL